MITLFVGTIASGKSTFSKKLAKQGFIIINDDSIINAIHADDYTLYDEKLKILYKGTENFICNTALALGKNVVVDKGRNLTKNARQRWIAIARSLDVPINCVLFDFETPEIHAERRFNYDHRGLTKYCWLQVANHHFEIFEKPEENEGFINIMSPDYFLNELNLQ